MKVKYLLTFALFSITFLVYFKIGQPNKNQPTSSNLPVHEVRFYDDKYFIEGTTRAEENFKPPVGKISGAVVNHNLLASFIIADLFKKVAMQNPQTLILIGPNHYEKGNFNVLTSGYAWNTKYGLVEPDELITNNLVSANLARFDEETLINDHATTALLPFIKFYMPSTKVVQLLISKKITKVEASTLSSFLVNYAKEGVVVVASTDFSHYLTSGQANIKDVETLKVINNFDYNTLISFNCDHLDSPGSLAILLMTMEKIGKTKQEIIYHENSSTIRPDFDSFTTSYFSMYYH